MSVGREKNESFRNAYSSSVSQVVLGTKAGTYWAIYLNEFERITDVVQDYCQLGRITVIFKFES